MNNKKQLGQYFSTRADYILDGMEEYVIGKNVCDPYAGDGDLLRWASKNGAKSVCGYDIDINYVSGYIKHGDSIRSSREYDMVITNPPYLHRNKSKDKSMFVEYEDIYMEAINSVMSSKEGLLIVPLNFLCSQNAEKIRRLFFSKYCIRRLHIFEEQVFDDTTYTVIALYYTIGKSSYIPTYFFPDKRYRLLEYPFRMPIENNKDKSIRRILEKDIKNGNNKVLLAYNNINKKEWYNVDDRSYDLLKKNIIVLHAIDSGTKEGKIKLIDKRELGIDGLISKETSRHQIHIITPYTIEEEEFIIKEFNSNINNLRDKYNSLFLTNYRDKYRKRIGFDMVYSMIKKPQITLL